MVFRTPNESIHNCMPHHGKILMNLHGYSIFCRAALRLLDLRLLYLYSRIRGQVSGIVTSNTLWCADKLIPETILQDRNKKSRRRIVQEINLLAHWFTREGKIRDNTK